MTQEQYDVKNQLLDMLDELIAAISEDDIDYLQYNLVDSGDSYSPRLSIDYSKIDGPEPFETLSDVLLFLYGDELES